MGWFGIHEPAPDPLALKRAAQRCSAQARAYWACVGVVAAATTHDAVASHLMSAAPTSSPPPPACEKLRDSLTHCLCESAFREVADVYARCAVAAAARGDFSRSACARERGVMARALRAAGLGPVLDAPPPPLARHERARAARRAAAATAAGA